MTDKIIYSDNFKQSSEFLRLVISLLAQHKIPADPHNYQIGYECVSGKNQALMNDLNKLFAQSSEPSEVQLNDLYSQYFIQDEAFFELMRQELRYIISNILKQFTPSGKQLNHYSKTLNEFIDILNGHDASASMMESTHRVIAETHSIKQSQQHMKEQMVKVIAEVDLLRKELEQVKEESKTDILTGIANRRAFDTTLEQSILASRENNKPFCLLLLDIDHFKKFNDKYGHLIGDKVLRYIATSLKHNIKGNDFLARFGGEEFVIILPATNISGAMTAAEQIRAAISAGKLTDKGANTSYGSVNISIGVTQFRASDSPNKLIERSDKALYLAKERGRNRVEKL